MILYFAVDFDDTALDNPTYKAVVWSSHQVSMNMRFSNGGYNFYVLLRQFYSVILFWNNFYIFLYLLSYINIRYNW